MTKVTFLDCNTIKVVALDGEIFTLKPHLPVPKDNQQDTADLLAFYFDENFSEDKTSMGYWVLMKMMAKTGFSFAWGGSDRSEERERIGTRIRQLREKKGIEAKALAKLADIDAANLSRIEQGRYAVGLDVLSRIAGSLGVKVDLI
ncbi:helix-turn-helix protein [Anseongella ginsenosidimutans]|uniref:Helix-turn-helix protein n=1 Tax=Anseongella ginsenosidimutans TaxID=496056 RepID=A0A4R3KM28_9SPHI|nr:helix-turn-helix transcriptional regulator [Anseongella ginsenosidimutans]QEC51952.1 helix-turn-helix transcriptional regulator [Anseongella ginsenosidimutans]TCS84737.1 helix-turn-helix protein [Anseongella ginsenosidimutans]